MQYPNDIRENKQRRETVIGNESTFFRFSHILPMSYRCLMVLPKYEGCLPHFVGVGVGAFGIVDGIVQATGLFALQSLAGNQITHIDHIA